MSAQLSNVWPPLEGHRWELKGGHVVLAEPTYAVASAHGRPGVAIMIVCDFWVPPARRGRGIAQGLMQAATRWADRSRTDLWLYCRPYGEGAKLNIDDLAEFYRSWDFRRVAPRSPDYEMVRRYGPRD